ncbi:MAG: YggT family protein [Patescibacteria group bacterium]
MYYLVYFISIVKQVLIFLIFIRVIMSWFNYHNQFVFDTTEWMLRPIRQLIGPIGGVIDISPIIAVIILEIGIDLILSLLIG